jgi:hypothetical protein
MRKRDSGDNYSPIEFKEKSTHISFRINLPKPPRWVWHILADVALTTIATLIIAYAREDPEPERIEVAVECPVCEEGVEEEKKKPELGFEFKKKEKGYGAKAWEFGKGLVE